MLEQISMLFKQIIILTVSIIVIEQISVLFKKKLILFNLIEQIPVVIFCLNKLVFSITELVFGLKQINKYM